MPWKFSSADPCECDWFGRAVAEPGVPIAFDSDMNEYHLVHDGPRGPGRMVLRYCPFCGGSAPKSRRSEKFARLTRAEISRLQALTAGLKTIAQVHAALGEPDQDLPIGEGTMQPEKGEGSAPTAEWFRTLIYNGLSETAVVRVSERHDGRVGFSFVGKQLPDAKRVDN